MANEPDFPRDDVERAWLAALPREAEVPPEVEERLVAALRQRSVRRRQWSVVPVAVGLAAALLFFVGGTFVGRELSRRDSMEWQLARTDLTPVERLLLLQRAGTDYARAMQRVAATPDDSIAAEVARQSLAAAALAATRTRLDGRLATTLVTLLEPATTTAAAPSTHLIWY